ncbi:GNAT family N-acetyltransferase [Nocardia otitidiscaviarum]|uniref:GNAT family N-acetyltransferase n=1 Tax=Nocardia otitidiscaviarum TaxID=1823 RepID=UPI000694C799|nr:GNAT family protein [Nocardia otitidiscaviarum]MBF6136761.1 GNAT family N-acetyltransferase [Nocardia otitidiscaviarum]MBF6484964.1 GNAT family N-acetyltransferase [Nocardia otitidiscaviarum]
MNAATTGLRLGPVHLLGSTLVLRPPRFADFAAWRHIRLRDRDLIEPFWHSSPQSWEQRHSAAHWVRECLEAATHARAGLAVSTVIELDGRFAGQVEIGGIDRRARHGEMGIWIDARQARHGFGGLAASVLLDYGFGVLGLERVVAPISVGNKAAAHGARQVGYVCEARLAGLFDVGGARTDHDLWAVTADRMPAGGFTRSWIEHVGARQGDASTRARHREGAPTQVEPTGPDAAAVTTDPGAVAEPTGPSAATVLAVSARYRAGQLRRTLHRILPAAPITVPVPGYESVVLRTPRAADARAWRAAQPGNKSGWYREFISSRTGFHTSAGLLLILDVGGEYAGECRLFDVDLFGRNARLRLRADPAHADDGVRAAAIRALVDFAFTRLGLYRVSTETPVADTASAAVAANAGLLEEGTMRAFTGPTGVRADHTLWASTRRSRG